ncbi:MAG: phosphatase PAP2 family protein [Verrucomicrobiae bacterium]
MDQDAFYFINHFLARPGLDVLMAVASSWDFSWPFLMAGGLGVLIFGGFHARAMVLVAGVSVGMTDGAVVNPLKHMVGRPRPHEILSGARTLDLAKARPRFLALWQPLKENYSRPGSPPARGNSFPSGHATNVFALATVAAVFYRRWGWLAYFPAALVSYSRIYVGSHWPLDILFSCFLGTGIALLSARALEACWRHWGAKALPQVCAAHPSLIAP